MRILFDYQAFEMQYFGGVSHSYAELIAHLRNEGCDCRIGLKESDNVHLQECRLANGIKPLHHTHNLLFEGKKHFKGERALAETLLKMTSHGNRGWDMNRDYSIHLLKRQHFDIFEPTFFDPYFLPYLNGKPFVLTVHDMIPELLGVDEVLAVGDAEFQKKAIGKMQDVSRGEGRTVLFVSHNMDAVLNLCKTGVLLENGKVKLISTAKKAIDTYTSSSTIGSSYINNVSTDKVYISHIQYFNNKNEETNHFTTEEPIIIRTTLQKSPNYPIPNGARYSINVFRDTKRICILECPLTKLNTGIETIIDFELPKQFFTSGTLHLDAAVHVPNIELLDDIHTVCQCDTLDAGTDTLKYNGIDCGVVLAHPITKIKVKQ